MRETIIQLFTYLLVCVVSGDVLFLPCSRLSEGSEEGEDDMVIDHDLLEVDVVDGSSGSSGSHSSSSDDERFGRVFLFVSTPAFPFLSINHFRREELN